MDLSSPRFKSLAVTAGFSFWFFIISSSLNFFTVELFAIFVVSLITITQIFSFKLSRILDLFAIFNTRIFLGISFIFVISLYGVLFKLLKIDLLRLKKQKNTYWLSMEQLKSDRISKQY